MDLIPDDSGLTDGGHGSLAWYYPASFASASSPAIARAANGVHYRHETHMTTSIRDLLVRGVPRDQYRFYVWNRGQGYESGPSNSLRVSLFAIGRWK